MVSAREAGILACGSSVAALVLSLLYVPALVMKIQDINEQLRVDSDEFRAMADMTWSELTKTRLIMGRHKRQSYDDAPKKTYALHGAYMKQDAFVESAPTCSKFSSRI